MTLRNRVWRKQKAKRSGDLVLDVNHINLNEMFGGSDGGGLEVIFTQETSSTWWEAQCSSDNSDQFIVQIKPAYVDMGGSFFDIKSPYTVITAAPAIGDGAGFKNCTTRVLSSTTHIPNNIVFDNTYHFHGESGSNSGDCVTIQGLNSTDDPADDLTNVLFQNCQLQWSWDETINAAWLAKDISFQECIIGLPTQSSTRADSTAHNFIASLGNGADQISIIDTILLGGNRRAPRMIGAKDQVNPTRRGNLYMEGVVAVRSISGTARAYWEGGSDGSSDDIGSDTYIDGLVAYSIEDGEDSTDPTAVFTETEDPSVVSTSKVFHQNLFYDSTYVNLNRNDDLSTTSTAGFWVPLLETERNNTTENDIVTRVLANAGPLKTSTYKSTALSYTSGKNPPIINFETKGDPISFGSIATIPDGYVLGSNGKKSPEEIVDLWNILKTQADPAFGPLDLPYAVLWYDGTDGPIDAGSGACSGWTDKSVFANHSSQATVGEQGVTGSTNLNALNVVQFASGDDLDISTFTNVDGTQNRTCFAVVRNDGSTSAGFPILSLGTNTNANRWSFFINNGALAISSGSGGATLTSTLIVGSSYNIVAVKLDGTTMGGHTLYMNGSPYTAASGASVDTLANANNNIGGWQFTSGEVTLAELALYDSALSDANMNLVGNYLADRWGLTWTDL